MINHRIIIPRGAKHVTSSYINIILSIKIS